MRSKSAVMIIIIAVISVMTILLVACEGASSKPSVTVAPVPDNTTKSPQSTREATSTPDATAKDPTTAPTKVPTPTSTPDVDTKKLIEDIKPIFSQAGGFYSGTQTLTITLSDTDKAVLHSIHVSYNQEEPTPGSRKYSSAITLPHSYSMTDASAKLTTSIVRAAVYDKKGNIIGKIATATYIKSSRNEDITLPVISLVTAQANLTGSDTGIIDNYNERGSAWERPVHFEFLETDGTLAVSQDAGIRIFGGSSRAQVQKSFRISARNSSYFETAKYDGDGKFKYAFFPGRLKEDGTELALYDSIVLRNGGNDAMVNSTQNIRASFLRDGLAAVITQEASNNVDSMAYRPVIVILNGEYYGILNMREHESGNYVANVYDIEDKDTVTIISSELNTSNGTRYEGSWFYYKQDEGLAGELARYTQIMQDIGDGKYTFEQAAQYVDMDNFLEYCAINIFLCNTDWPHNNVRLWKAADGKYKFMIRDADLGMARYTMATKETAPSELYTKADAFNFRYMMWSELSETQRAQLIYYGYPSVNYGVYPDPLLLKGVLHFCLQDQGFRTRFVDYCERLATEIWPVDKLQTMVIEQRDTIAVEMRYHFSKWATNISDSYYQYWYKNTVEESIGQWINQRTGENGYFIKEIYAVCSTYGEY